MTQTKTAAARTDLLAITGILHMKRPFHVGSGQGSLISDAVIKRDHRGRPYVPASSLAGLLRTAAEGIAPFVTGQRPCADRSASCITCDLFGWTPPGADRGEGQASRVFVENAYAAGDLPNAIDIRDHVGMNRRRGAAQEHLHYNREVAPGGLDFAFNVSVQEPTSAELTLLLAVLDQWAHDDFGLQVGSRTRSGLGDALIKDSHYYHFNFSQPASLAGYLLDQENGGQPNWHWPKEAIVAREDLKPAAAVVYSGGIVEERYLPQRFVVDLQLEALEPLLVVGYAPPKVQEVEKESDASFVTTLNLDDQGELVEEVFLPGSSFKGILRTRAEAVVRTLDYFSLDPPRKGKPSQAGQEFYEQRISACAITHAKGSGSGDDPQRLLACFGGSRMKKSENAKEPALYKDSCVTCRLFGNTALAGRLLAGDGRLDGKSSAKLFDHVAIDRFSGGVADERKYDSKPLRPGVRFKSRLVLERLEPWMIGFASLLIRELIAGDIWIGAKTHSGFGRVRATVDSAQLYLLPGSETTALLAKHQLAAGNDLMPYLHTPLDLQALFTSSGELTGHLTTQKAFLEACFNAFKDTVHEVQDRSVNW